jgi:hypothetical protein
VDNRNEKGCYTADDWNRVGEAIHYLANILTNYGYSLPVTARSDWLEEEWPTVSDVTKYLQDIEMLRDSFTQLDETPHTPETMENLQYYTANDIETILLYIDNAQKRMKAAFFYTGEIYTGEV